VAEDNSTDSVAAASTCDDRCNEECKELSERCCEPDTSTTTCNCKPTSVPCDSWPPPGPARRRTVRRRRTVPDGPVRRRRTVQVVAEDNSTDSVGDYPDDPRSPCDHFCQEVCHDPGTGKGAQYCCGQAGSNCLCGDFGFDCASEPSNTTRWVKVVKEDHSTEFVSV